MAILPIQQITAHALQLFEKELTSMYKPTYTMRFRYGKYSIYKSEYDINQQRKHTTTLAKGLSKEEATGMMKLLEDKDE